MSGVQEQASPTGTPSDTGVVCDECGMVKPTPQSLGRHKVLAHNATPKSYNLARRKGAPRKKRTPRPVEVKVEASPEPEPLLPPALGEQLRVVALSLDDDGNVLVDLLGSSKWRAVIFHSS